MTGFRHLTHFVGRVNAKRQRHKKHQPPDNNVDDNAGRPGHNRRRLKPDNMHLRQGTPAKFITKDPANRTN